MDLELQLALKKFISGGLTVEQIEEFEVIVLPENFDGEHTQEDLVDAQDAITLSKFLKQANIKCANSYDLNLEVPTIERRSNDIWLGEIIIIKDIVLPLLIGVISSYLSSNLSERKKRKDDRSPIGNVHTEITIVRPEGLTTIKYDGDSETLVKILDSLPKDAAKEQ